MSILKFICHSYKAISIAKSYGWMPGANYHHLRDLKRFQEIGFLDIDWQDYDFQFHLKAVKQLSPLVTVARDIVDVQYASQILDESIQLSKWAKYVVIVPKDKRLTKLLPDIVPEHFLLGYSVPSNYGKTDIPLSYFKNRKVHLLGGHPAKQREIAEYLNVFSIDCNRLTLDATYGDFFDGETFRPHPIGGYEVCLKESIININSIWNDYK